MKVVIFVPSDKIDDRGVLILTEKVIGEFDVKEPIYSELSDLGIYAEGRFDTETSVDPKTQELIIESIKTNKKGFVAFYGQILKLSGLSEEDIVKYGFSNADVALEQIYLAWTKDEKK